MNVRFRRVIAAFAAIMLVIPFAAATPVAAQGGFTFPLCVLASGQVETFADYEAAVASGLFDVDVNDGTLGLRAGADVVPCSVEPTQEPEPTNPPAPTPTPVTPEPWTPEPTVEPVPTDPPVTPEPTVVPDTDADDDGVDDEFDVCANTPEGAIVDSTGCIPPPPPVDSDGDGVYDPDDDCEYTPPQTEVDEFGCEVDEPGKGPGTPTVTPVTPEPTTPVDPTIPVHTPEPTNPPVHTPTTPLPPIGGGDDGDGDTDTGSEPGPVTGTDGSAVGNIISPLVGQMIVPSTDVAPDATDDVIVAALPDTGTGSTAASAFMPLTMLALFAAAICWVTRPGRSAA